MTEVYKAVFCYDGKWVSLFTPASLRAVYERGVETFPTIPGSKLFAYSSHGYALRACFGCRIWRCEATGVIEPPFINIPCPLYPGDMVDFWRHADARSRVGDHFPFGTTLHEGTVLCDSITLVERVS